MNAVVNEAIEVAEGKYIFPTEARIDHILFSQASMLIHLTDGRALSVPLNWVPTLAKAQLADLEKYHLGNDATTIHWDTPNLIEHLRLSSYMGDGRKIALDMEEVPPSCAEIRKQLGLTQQAFADRLGVSIRTIQEWEQGRALPSGPALTLLRMAYQAPSFFLNLP